MRWSLMLGLLGACTGTSEDDDKPVTDDDDGDDDGNTPTGETGTDGTGDYFEPVAVGFEFDGVVLPDGTPGSYLYDDPTDGLTYERYPLMIVTFASLEYFEDTSQTDEEIAARTCSVVAVPWTPSPIAGQIPTHDGALLHYSYDVALDLEIDPDSTDCDEELDPAVWGEDAEGLLEQFDGMHFGYGWGQQTEYLTEPWEQETLDDEEFMSSWLASYVAINDAAGEWVGYDWTYGFAFQWDIETGYLVTVPDPDPPATYPDRQLLVRQEVTDIPAGDPLPPMYIRSSAYWYQDFPLMDLSNLKDGAP